MLLVLVQNETTPPSLKNIYIYIRAVKVVNCEIELALCFGFQQPLVYSPSCKKGKMKLTSETWGSPSLRNMKEKNGHVSILLFRKTIYENSIKQQRPVPCLMFYFPHSWLVSSPAKGVGWGRGSEFRFVQKTQHRARLSHICIYYPFLSWGMPEQVFVLKSRHQVCNYGFTSVINQLGVWIWRCTMDSVFYAGLKLIVG